MNKDSMNTGVQIILDRMDTNPEEFMPEVTGKYSDKWRNIILSVHMRVEGGKDYEDQLSFLNDKEIKAMYDKLEDVRRENFTIDVLRRLAETPIQEDLFTYRKRP